MLLAIWSHKILTSYNCHLSWSRICTFITTLMLMLGKCLTFPFLKPEHKINSMLPQKHTAEKIMWNVFMCLSPCTHFFMCACVNAFCVCIIKWGYAANLSACVWERKTERERSQGDIMGTGGGFLRLILTMQYLESFLLGTVWKSNIYPLLRICNAYRHCCCCSPPPAPHFSSFLWKQVMKQLRKSQY